MGVKELNNPQNTADEMDNDDEDDDDDDDEDDEDDSMFRNGGKKINVVTNDNHHRLMIILFNQSLKIKSQCPFQDPFPVKLGVTVGEVDI
ncbi:hypothetical protein QR98_0036340 [Sarcoptes scabiei]|uniref:Uncharacterized protein n=1 Tax=Sarcoptes scabiei TaxID=52283 RepID=A0A132A3I3_SARSC|nr:hypothetical protein QR98_0036340 [Sarcoptes scabiei]